MQLLKSSSPDDCVCRQCLWGKGLIRDKDIILGLQGLKEAIVSPSQALTLSQQVSDVIRAGPICQDWQRKKGKDSHAASASILDSVSRAVRMTQIPTSPSVTLFYGSPH